MMTSLVATSLAMAPTALSCPSLPGADPLLATPGLRWLVVGEMHGTIETPARFGDLVCQAATRRRPVVVGLELPATDQPAIDAWLASDGGVQARAALLALFFWHWPSKDGRSSHAMFQLLDRLRVLHGAGQVVRVVVFQPVGAGAMAMAGYEQAMAEPIRAAAPVDGLMLVLVGNLHARMTEAAFGGRPAYRPMAAWLPAAATVSVDVPIERGSAWGCYSDAPVDANTSPPCGPYTFPAASGRSAAGFQPNKTAGGPYRWTWQLGVPVSASPPEVP